MSDESVIRVNFGRPIPLFPIDSVLLLPHGVIPLHIFEPRYRALISDALDGPGLVAMASFADDEWKRDYDGVPALRPAVCVGRIVEHHKLADGRFNVALQGVCRARIAEESQPEDDRLYRTALLEPIGAANEQDEVLDDARDQLREALEVPPLDDLRNADEIASHLRDDDAPTAAILELLALAYLSEPDQRYQFLAEPQPDQRASIIMDELDRLRELLQNAQPQRRHATQRGCSWN